MSEIVVVGGGFGGLLLAVELERRGARPLVLEASSRPGGVARTVREDGYLLEPAASSLLLPHPHLGPILERAGARLVPATAAARRRVVLDRGRLVTIAESPAALFTPVLSWRGKLRAAGEPLVPRRSADAGEEPLAAFLTRRFGREAGRLGATLMAHGVFAADPDRLSAEAAFPGLVDLERTDGSVLRGAVRRLRARPAGTPRRSVHVPAAGMAGLAAELAAHLGERFRPGRPVRRVTRGRDGWHVLGEEEIVADTVVLAVPPAAAADIAPDELAGDLRRIPTAPVAVVALGGRAADLPIPAAFGILAGPRSGVRVLGVLCESAYAPGRAGAGRRLVKMIYGGGADPEVVALSDDRLVALAVTELGGILGLPALPSWTKVVRIDPGIPQYTVGHRTLLRRLETTCAARPGLHLAGWGYRGVGLSGLATDAHRLATRILGS